MENIGGKSKEKWQFEVPPPIPQKDIKEVINTDVAVVGAGLAGVCAAISALEAGAKTVLLEKGNTCHARGRGNAAIGSKLQKEQGIEIDRDEVVAEIMRWGGYRPDQRLVTLWADRSGEVMDWLLDMAAAAGITTKTGAEEVRAGHRARPAATTGGSIKSFSVAHHFHPGQEKGLMAVMEAKMRELGVDIRYEIPVVLLIREGRGRVTGVIAQSKDGYKQFNARAVVLCTGGYEHNREMMAKYVPRALQALSCAYDPPLTTGDGHKMGLWVGAAMEEEPHCANLFDGGGEHLMGSTRQGVGLARQPWLNVNILGERYVREDIAWTLTASADMAQPGHVKWAVWDGNWEEDTKRFGMGGGKALYFEFHGTTPELYQEKIRKGAIIKVDTLEELVRRMEVPYETFMATVKRYNELARMGKDMDFGKNPSKLSTIEKPPFYAAKMGATLMVTLGGLKINTKLQVLDTDWKVIPGLYAAGNVSGGFFANDYCINFPGITHGRAFTFGRLAGLNAAAEKV